MSFVWLTFLFSEYWVFLTLALIIGILTGWFSASGPAK